MPHRHPFLSSFGRRVGKRLGAGQKILLTERLPELAIPPHILSENLHPAAVFPSPFQEIHLELGFGGGEFLSALARRHPSIGFIGCEPYLNGVANLLKLLEGHSADNVRIWPEDARFLLQSFTPGSLQKIYILFPDPWPKSRHHKRRIVSDATLDLLSAALAKNGELVLATDHEDYAAWMHAHLERHPAFTWITQDHRTPPESWTTTRYETKTRGFGREPMFFRLKNTGSPSRKV